MSAMLERMKEVPAEIIEQFLKKKQCLVLTKEMQDYIIRINAVPSIIHHNVNSMTVVTKILRQQFKELTYAQAREIYYDAMNFFYMDDAISADSWDNYYAEQQEKLAKLAIASNKLDSASRCFEKARTYRMAASERIKPGEWKVPVFVITNKIKPEDLGYKSQKIYDIMRKDEDNYYLKTVKSLPTTDEDKKRIIGDLGIEDVEAEILEDSDNEE